MPGIADLLSRLRPAGAPGSAVRERLRVDHAAELAAELGSVLDMLAAADARCAAAVAAADRQAAGITAAASDRAASISADGRARAEAARTAAASEVLAAARADAERIQRATEASVRARQRPAEADVRALADEAVRLVTSMRPGGASEARRDVAG
ncbi:MAG TPA: hypothetical protein VFW16_06540 [Streptosporangiaceae bacterium]|nr:hypothetical protein [Streptosporangiaceae bacterium]